MPAADRLITHHNGYYSAQPVSQVLLTAYRLMPTHHTDYSLLIFGKLEHTTFDQRAGSKLALTDYTLLLFSKRMRISMISSFHLFSELYGAAFCAALTSP